MELELRVGVRLLGVDERQLEGVEVDPAVVAVARRACGVLRVADAAAAGPDDVEERVLLAVDVGLEEVERLAGGLALEPELVAARGPHLKEHEIDWVILAGFLWLVPEEILKAFPNRIINIHPALLPKFGGKGIRKGEFT